MSPGAGFARGVKSHIFMVKSDLHEVVEGHRAMLKDFFGEEGGDRGGHGRSLKREG